MPTFFKTDLVASVWLVCAGALWVGGCGTASAQGGPPMVTDDPDTPGDGHWEINIAAQGSHRRDSRRDLALPDADINYGWGEHLQLKLDLPWAAVREADQATRSGLGAVNVGVKWRFIDAADSGYAMATYPQLLSSWSNASTRRELAPEHQEFLLPLELSTQVGEFNLDGEVGHNFVQHESGNWIAGGIVAHACGAERECMLELRTTVAAHETQTLLNAGMHWRLGESLTLLGSLGREFGRRGADQQTATFYLGLQWQR